MAEKKAGPLAKAVDANVPPALIARAKMLYAHGVFRPSEADDTGEKELASIAKALQDDGYEVTDEDVIRWRNNSAPDGIAWNDLRNAWSGRVASGEMVPFPVDGEEDALRRVLGNVEHMMAIASRAMRDIELFDADGNAVDFLFTKEGVAVPMRGLRPGKFVEVKDSIKVASEIIASTTKRLNELQEGIADRQQVVAEVAKEILDKLNLSFEQQERLREMMISGEITTKVGGSTKAPEHGGDIPELGPGDVDVAAEPDEGETDFDRELREAEAVFDGEGFADEEDDDAGEAVPDE